MKSFLFKVRNRIARGSGGKPSFLTCSFLLNRTRIREQIRKGGLPPLIGVICFLFASMHAFAQAPPGPRSPLYGARPEHGNPATGLPEALQEVRIEQKLDQQLPLDLIFRDESGQQVKLGQFFGSKPVVLSFVYYDCPMLCTQVLNGMVTSFRVLPFQIGNEFDVVTVSFDPRETSALAAAKKKVYIDYLPEKMRPGAQSGWHFLTGDQENIKKLTEAVGFHYRYDEKTKQFAHGSAIMLTTPQGKLSRYFYGIEYAPRDLRLGLMDSSTSKIGSPVEQLLLYCYQYDPATGKYGAAVMRIMRVAGVLTLIGIVAMLLLLKPRNRGVLKTGGAAS